MILKRWLLPEGKPLNSTTMRSREHCITDHMMESSSAACHIKRHKKHSKRLVMICADLTSMVQSFEIDSEDWDIIGQRWSLTSSLTLSDAMPVRDFIHPVPGHLRPTTSSWTFEMWKMNVVGPIRPPLSKGHQYILAITDYFSNWVEAIPQKLVKASVMIKFIKHHVIYHFGVAWRIVHNNGPQFVSQAF